MVDAPCFLVSLNKFLSASFAEMLCGRECGKRNATPLTHRAHNFVKF
jgi:hypothetical protein